MNLKLYIYNKNIKIKICNYKEKKLVKMSRFIYKEKIVNVREIKI